MKHYTLILISILLLLCGRVSAQKKGSAPSFTKLTLYVYDNKDDIKEALYHTSSSDIVSSHYYDLSDSELEKFNSLLKNGKSKQIVVTGSNMSSETEAVCRGAFKRDDMVRLAILKEQSSASNGGKKSSPYIAIINLSNLREYYIQEGTDISWILSLIEKAKQ